MRGNTLKWSLYIPDTWTNSTSIQIHFIEPAARKCICHSQHRDQYKTAVLIFYTSYVRRINIDLSNSSVTSFINATENVISSLTLPHCGQNMCCPLSKKYTLTGENQWWVQLGIIWHLWLLNIIYCTWISYNGGSQLHQSKIRLR